MKDEDFNDEEYGYTEEETKNNSNKKHRSRPKSKPEPKSNKEKESSNEDPKIDDMDTGGVDSFFDIFIPDWELDDNIKEELAGYDVFIINYEPIKFYIAHYGLNQIVRGGIGKENIVVTDDDGNIEYEDDIPVRKQCKKLRLSVPIINAIPTSVIK